MPWRAELSGAIRSVDIFLSFATGGATASRSSTGMEAACGFAPSVWTKRGSAEMAIAPKGRVRRVPSGRPYEQKGTFRWPRPGEESIELARTELNLLLAGIDLRDCRKRRWLRRQA